MIKLMFIPFRLAGSLLAGLVAGRLFDRVWRLVDRDQVPNPGYREVSMVKLVSALLLQGALFSATRGLFDHASRVAFRRVTGRWPGEEGPTAQDA